MGQSFTEKEGSIVTFRVDATIDSGKIKFTITDSANLLILSKMIRAVLCDAIDQWLASKKAQLVTNGVSVGNDITDDLGGRNFHRPQGDGYNGFTFNFAAKACWTPAITVTLLDSANITVAIPFADVD